MFVKTLKLKNFRNYDELDLKLNSNLNIVIGKNAQGKTNLIEAIFFACFGKSFRTNKDKDLIKIDKEYNYAHLNIQKTHTDIEIKYRIHEKLNKEIKINNSSITKLSDILGNIYVVLFSPEDLKLIKGSPGIRRNFLNREMSNINKKTCHELMTYKKILKQRNNLLKKLNNRNEKMLEIFTEQLIETGSKVIFNRFKFIEKLSEISLKIHKNLTNNEENFTIKYLSNISLDKVVKYDKIKESFRKKIDESIKREKKLGYTLVGPHRDDFEIFINDKEIKKYGSQGQQRTAALSLKLSEIYLIKRETNEYPILLLDDVFSELDIYRQESLMKIFEKTQTIITSTSFNSILKNKIKNYKVIEINNGKKHKVGGNNG